MYPTLEEVENADRYTLCKWYRFLPSPGESVIGTDKFNEVLEREVKIINRICERLKEVGGFTPEISKSLGWGQI